MDYAHKETDKMLERLEKDITEVYKEAQQEAYNKCAEYFKTFMRRDKEMKAKVDAGELTEDEYKQWRINKMTVGKRYNAMQEGLATDLTNANKLAASMINNHLPDVYATNYNWSTYQIEQDARMDTNFMIYDRQTVERLIRDKPNLLPMKAGINIPEDKKWNKKNINNAITQGILLGESIPDISKRLAAVTDMNRVSAIRNARTMTTSAENGGRVDSYHRAIDMGIKITQKWLATKDNRTRHEHVLLDGQEVDVGKPFKVEGYTIMFPADPQAEPHLVYNCRCTLVSKFKGFDYKKMDEYTEAKPMSYKEWEEKHKTVQNKPHVPQPDRPPTKEGWLYKTGYTFTEKTTTIFAEMNEAIETADEDVQKVWKKYAPQLNYAKPPLVTQSKAKAYYHPKSNRVHLYEEIVRESTAGHPKYETFFHEYGHNIDYIADGTKKGYSYTTFWKNDKGETLNDIIQREWKDKFSEKLDTLSIAKKAYAERLSSGMNGETITKSALAEWRKNNEISFRSDEYKKLKEELEKCETQVQYFEFYKKYADKFVTDADRNKYNVIDKDKVKSYIKKTRDEYNLDARGNLSDMFEEFTVKEADIEYPLGMGHGKKYWTEKGGSTAREAFAEMFSASIANRESLELIKQELPETYAAFKQILKEIM